MLVYLIFVKLSTFHKYALPTLTLLPGPGSESGCGVFGRNLERFLPKGQNYRIYSMVLPIYHLWQIISLKYELCFIPATP